MGLGELGRIARRWRWLIVFGVLLAVGAGGAGFRVTPPSYTQSESYLLLSPVTTSQGDGNPFLQLGNGVSMAASVLAAKVNSSETAASVVAGHPGLTYSVSPDATTSAPILVVTAADQHADVVSDTLDRVGNELVSQLDALQEDSGAPEVSWVTISLLTRDPAPAPDNSDQLRMAAAGAGGALVLVLALVTLLERRRRNCAARAAAKAAAAAAPTPERRPDDDRPTGAPPVVRPPVLASAGAAASDGSSPA